MKTFIYKWGNPTKYTFILQAEDWESAEKRVKAELAKKGVDTTNGYAEVHTILTPIEFI